MSAAEGAKSWLSSEYQGSTRSTRAGQVLLYQGRIAISFYAPFQAALAYLVSGLPKKTTSSRGELIPQGNPLSPPTEISWPDG